MIQNTFKQRVIGIDISLEYTTYAIVDVRGNIIAKDFLYTQEYPNINEFVSNLCEKAMMLAEANGGYENIRSVGVSAPSANFLTGCIEYSPRMPWKGEVPLAALMRDRLGLAVAVANDAHVRGLGEQAFGCAHGMKDFIILALGFGLGSCCFSNGVPHLGYHGYAGEIGHTCIVEGGRKCDCGNLGCLEIYCAHKGIIKNAYDVLAESDEPSLMRDCEKLDPKIIADMCDKGDKLAIEVYRRAGSILGLGIANYTSVFNPEAIIFTGGISRAGKWLLEPCNEAFEKYVFHNVHGKVKILTSILEESDRDVLGASVLAWGMKEYSLFK
jgi:glucokinase